MYQRSNVNHAKSKKIKGFRKKYKEVFGERPKIQKISVWQPVKNVSRAGVEYHGYVMTFKDLKEESKK